eukprot:jgi/Botrbrau1/19961/Bobra.0059s0077.1
MAAFTSGQHSSIGSITVPHGQLPGGHRSSFYGGSNVACLHTKDKRHRSEVIGRRSATPTVCFAEPPNTVKLAGDDYYTILGVAYDATQKEIKSRYYEVMREIHPDLSDDAEQELAHELATFLNHVYETLSDPDERAAYDNMVGLCINAVNPFNDKNQVADQVFVDEMTCIGCRNCTNVCPNTFSMEDDFGRARVMRQKVDTDEGLQEAIDTCPVNCIHWVSEAQLSLLETTMASMERIDVWQLMTGGGKAVNVFVEASLAWARRQSLIKARQQTAAAQKRAAGLSGIWASFGGDPSPAGGSTMWAGAGRGPADDRIDSGGREARRAAAASVGAAAAARRWRDYQRNKRAREQILLTTSHDQ